MAAGTILIGLQMIPCSTYITVERLTVEGNALLFPLATERMGAHMVTDW